MTDIFLAKVFSFPYDYKFPGQGSNERILFVTRENTVMLALRRLAVMATAVMVLGVGLALAQMASFAGAITLTTLIQGISVALAGIIASLGWWWTTQLWKMSLMLVTNQRLAKIIYTTPFNRHILSLPLDMIVDTGSYTKGFLQALFKLGTFTARSSAASSGVATDDNERVNKKYFYIENIAIAEDLQHYVNKLLYAFRHHHEHLATFRPFIPELKGEARKRFMEQYPEYWS